MDAVGLRDAWERSFRGDQEGAAQYRPNDPDGQAAWSLCLSTTGALAGLCPAPSLSSFEAFDAADEVRGMLAVAACLRARLSLLSFDRPAFDDALARAVRLESGSGSVHAALWVEVTTLWSRVLNGELQGLETRLDALAGRGSRERFAELVIEANVLRAALALEREEIELATTLSRRVSRMARAEGMPHQEVLAHVVLARTRRHSERAHLASRILRALWVVAPAPFRPWLGWELRLTGEAIPAHLGGPGKDAQGCIEACLASDASRFERHAANLRASVSGFGPMHREADALLCALSPRIEPTPHLLEWASGRALRMPLGLDSVVSSLSNPHVALSGNAWVMARPDGARRFLHPAIGLGADLPIFEQTARKHGRTETAMAVLALTGAEGMPVARFVREVYGFAYVKEAHDGMLRVLLHRMRSGWQGAASIEVDGDRIRMHATSNCWVPDPRTSPPSSEPVLRMIAAQPGASAKEIAAALSIPLRTVQAVLNQLVADGSCAVARAASGVAYSIEDTTFSEPTRTGATDAP